MIVVKFLISAAIVHAYWIGWQAIYNPSVYERIFANPRSREWGGRRTFIGKLAVVRLVLCVFAVLATSFIALEHFLSFIPYNWGKWEDGEFTPMSSSLAAMLSFLTAYLVCSAFHTVGLRGHTVSVEVDRLATQMDNLKTSFSEQAESQNDMIEDLRSSLAEAEESSKKASRAFHAERTELQRKLSATAREVSRVNALISGDIIEDIEAGEKAKEAFVPKSRTYYF